MAKAQPRKLDLSRLSPAAQAALAGSAPAALPAPAPPARAAADWALGLTPAAQAALAAIPPEPAVPEPAEAAHYLFAAHDGAWPQEWKFRTPEGLARELGRLDGQDVVVRPWAGMPLAITKGPQRYLLSADGKTAWTVPTAEGLPVKRLDADLIAEIPLQEDGYLGPDVLVRPRVLVPPLGKPKPKPEPPADPGDPEDDEEADEDEPGAGPAGPSVTI